jgi:hypothetical protein
MVAEVNPIGSKQENIGRSASQDENAVPGRRKTIDRRQPEEERLYQERERRRIQERRNAADAAAEKLASEASSELSKEEREKRAHEEVRLKRLLSTCEKVMMVNYNLLALDEYPSNLMIDRATKTRDAYISAGGLASGVFVIGLGGLLPAWVTGASFGLALLFFVFALSELQSLVHNAPSLSHLMRVRRQLEFNALAHIKYLEGGGGLAWRCAAMSDYNKNLHNNLFAALVGYSKNGVLLKVLRSKKHIRLYLLFMIEAQKAYKNLQAKVLSS